MGRDMRKKAEERIPALIRGSLIDWNIPPNEAFIDHLAEDILDLFNDESPAGDSTKRSFLCFVGFHRWEWLQKTYGHTFQYKRCQRCAKERIVDRR
ncbi:MAG: hypothetical protein KAT71_08425 [Gammaproteobacteria bacterium]|nr:hypothetical protein [Gammaproteobacteria bacterium]